MRKGENIASHDRIAGAAYFFERNISTNDAEKMSRAGANQWSNSQNIFTDNLGDIPGTVIQANFAVTSDFRLRKLSPIKPNNFREPLR